MSINNILKINSLFAILFLFSCENLEETYKDYTGDGKIKYAGKCKSFTVTAGWKRFVFQWERSSDSNIKSIEIFWKNDKGSGVYTFPADQTSFETEATFEDYPCSFECYAVGEDGNKSIPVVQYSRPYTFTHELVLGFPRMVNKYIFIGNEKIGHDLILFFDNYKEDVKSTKLTYSQAGQQKEMIVTKEMFDGKYYVLKNVDINKDVIINRVAEIEGCLDQVIFEPIVLKPEYVSLNLDFEQQIRNRYNILEITPDFIEQQKVLEFDYTLKSLEDILYFPNLETIIIGGNRFTVPESKDGMMLSLIGDKERSIFAINRLNEKIGTKVQIHNNHYEIESELPFAEKLGDPQLPTLEYLNTENWTVESSTKEGDDKDGSFPERILDNNSSTLWAPFPVDKLIRTHDLIIDMKSEQTINGFKVSQALRNESVAKMYYQGIIKIQLSDDKEIWREAFYQLLSTIGQNYGESTILRTPVQEKAQYIKITLLDNAPLGAPRNNTCLGDFMVF